MGDYASRPGLIGEDDAEDNNSICMCVYDYDWIRFGVQEEK